MNSKLAIKQLNAIKKHIRAIEKKRGKIRLAAKWPKPWQIMISTILSPMTKDEVTIPVCKELFKK